MVSTSFNDDLPSKLLEGRVGLPFGDEQLAVQKFSGAEVLDEYLSHPLFVLAAAVVLQRQDYGGVVGVHFTEPRYAVYHILKEYGLGCGVAMLNDGDVAIVVYIQLHASHPVLEVLYIALYLGVAGELVAGEVGVVGGVAVVVVQWIVLAELLLLQPQVDDSVLFGEEVGTEVVERYLLGFVGEYRIDDVLSLLGGSVLMSYQKLPELQLVHDCVSELPKAVQLLANTTLEQLEQLQLAYHQFREQFELLEVHLALAREQIPLALLQQAVDLRVGHYPELSQQRPNFPKAQKSVVAGVRLQENAHNIRIDLRAVQAVLLNQSLKSAVHFVSGLYVGKKQQ